MRLGTSTVQLAGGARAIDSLKLLATAAAQLHRWAASREGWRRTDRVLRALDREVWQVTRPIGLPDGDHAHHLVVGADGVYLLDSQAWQGVVTVDHKGATITPDGRPRAAWTARGQHCSLAPAAAALGRAASAAGSSLRPPRAVVVIWATFPERLAVSGGITYVAGEHLVEWLACQARRPGQQATRNSYLDPLVTRPLAGGARLPGQREPAHMPPPAAGEPATGRTR